jgi:DNA-directed RNA polymerase beta' subunit
MAKSKPGRLNIINRDEYQSFVPSPVIEYRVPIRIKSVRFDMVDHDAVYAKLKKQGKKVDIVNDKIYVNGNQKPDDGIFSSVFGSDTTQDKPFYSCDCQELTGAAKLGEICPKCHKPVVAVLDGDLRTTMYIDIAPYHILTYHGYNAMCRVFKDKVMEDIITSVKRISTSGKVIDDGKPTIVSLYDDYEEKYEPLTGLPKEYAFCSKIPVYSSRLRPLMVFGMNMTILDVNKYYLSIVNNRNILATAPLFHMERKTEIQKTLNQIQQDFNNITKFIETQINGKGGVYRKSMASGRIDYTSRMVISLGIDLMPHEVDIPYQTMMVVYEERIAKYLSTLEGISISKAITIVQDHAMERDEKFVKIINQLLKSKTGVWALINRNPTISESSILYVRVRKIHEDGTDMTMHMPPDILQLLAAD